VSYLDEARATLRDQIEKAEHELALMRQALGPLDALAEREEKPAPKSRRPRRRASAPKRRKTRSDKGKKRGPRQPTPAAGAPTPEPEPEPDEPVTAGSLPSSGLTPEDTASFLGREEIEIGAREDLPPAPPSFMPEGDAPDPWTELQLHRDEGAILYPENAWVDE
jgi:hypothetical protein